MRKPDDSSLDPSQYAKVRKEARRLLVEADAIGRFPTPVDEIMAVAEVCVDPEDVLDTRFIANMRRKAGATLKRALSKVLGLFDAQEGLVFIDRAVKAAKRTFVKLHETAHAVMIWQRKMYAVVEDCKKTLDPDVSELFDREANVFATEVLFQLDGFIREAEDKPFGIRAPLSLSKKYGASAYASIRQYVAKNQSACAVLILDAPELHNGDGFRANLRRVVVSALFRDTFGQLSWPDEFTPDDDVGAMIPVGGRRMSSPRSFGLADMNGVRHECLAEGFCTPFHVFILIHEVRALTRRVFVLPARPAS